MMQPHPIPVAHSSQYCYLVSFLPSSVKVTNFHCIPAPTEQGWVRSGLCGTTAVWCGETFCPCVTEHPPVASSASLQPYASTYKAVFYSGSN